MNEMPKFAPNTQLKVQVLNGTLSLVSPSKLLNVADEDMTAPPNVKCSVWKNGAKAASASIDGTTGEISGGSVSVSANDAIEVRVETWCKFLKPWRNWVFFRRSAFLVVPSGNQDFVFDDSNYKQPVPGYDCSLGWDSANNKFKLAFKFTATDSASQDMTVWTRRLGPCPNLEASATIDPDGTGVQTHTSTFVKSEVVDSFQVETLLPSGTGTPRQEDRVRITFVDIGEVPTWPGDPPTNKNFTQTRDLNRLKLDDAP